MLDCCDCNAKKNCLAEFSLGDFELYTIYENSSYCKPTLEYYNDSINEFDVLVEESLMVGKDVLEDMVVE